MAPEVDAAQTGRMAGPKDALPAPAVPAPAVPGVEIGQEVRIAGKRGCYRVVGFRPGGVQLMDDDQKWHVVRPEAVRLMPSSPASRSGRTRPASA